MLSQAKSPRTRRDRNAARELVSRASEEGIGLVVVLGRGAESIAKLEGGAPKPLPLVVGSEGSEDLLELLKAFIFKRS